MEWTELGAVQTAALALAVLSGTLLLMLVFFWSRQSRRAGVPSASAQTSEHSGDLLRLKDELNQLVRDSSERLDARMHILSELLQEAHATIAELRQLAPPRVAETELTKVAKQSVAIPQAVPPTHAAPARARISGSTAVAESKPAEAAELEPADTQAQRFAHVYARADAGLDAPRIAAEIGVQRGEVELFLNLRRKKNRLDRGARPEPSRISSYPEEVQA